MHHIPDDLPEDLRNLLDDLRALHFRLREYRYGKWRRIDPFVETLFDRTEKARTFCDSEAVIHDSCVMLGDVTVGDGTHVGQFCTLDGSGGLVIGRNCSIAVGSRIMTHDTVDWAVTNGKAEIVREPVSIGDCCYIGANAVITKGVTIGDCAVIGANAVVTRDVESHAIVGGVPARFLGRVVVDGEKVRYEYGCRDE